jgi:hypothetical protein
VAVIVCTFTGALIYDAINPRILLTSALDLMLEATRENVPSGGATIVDLHAFTFSRIPYFVSLFPDTPLTVTKYVNRSDLRRHEPGDSGPAAATFLWSPAVELECDVAQAVCAEWPTATIFTMRSKSGMAKAYAADIGVSGWKPRLPKERWSAASCATHSDPYPGEPRRLICAPDDTPLEQMRPRLMEFLGPRASKLTLG